MSIKLGVVKDKNNKQNLSFSSIEEADKYLSDNPDIKSVSVQIVKKENGEEECFNASFNPSEKNLTDFLLDFYNKIESKKKAHKMSSFKVGNVSYMKTYLKTN